MNTKNRPLSPFQIFDLDGTLLDSMTVWRTIGADYLRSLGVEPPPDLVEITKEMSILRSAAYFVERWSLPYTRDQVKEGFIGLMEAKYRDELPLKPGAASFLRRQHQAGARLCVLTASEEANTDAALTRLGVRQYFDFVLTCTQAGMGKEGPEIYRLAAKRLGGSAENTLVFEDALHAIRSAHGAGFEVIGVYDAIAAPDRDKIQPLCRAYIHSFDEL